MGKFPTDLQEDHDDEDGVADGEDSPQHPHRLGVPHELGGVVVGLLVVVHLTLHGEAVCSTPARRAAALTALWRWSAQLS